MTVDYALCFGGIDLSPTAAPGGVSYRVYGLRRGYPAPVTSAVNSMLQDGAIERIDRHDNRDQTLIIGLRADDAEALADAESALFIEAQKPRNELIWSPPGGVGAATVFDVLWASLEFADADDWDIEELRLCERVYTLTVRALPFGRAASEVVDAALVSSATPTSVTISDGTSATGWTSPDGAVTVSSGRLSAPSHVVSSTYRGAGAGDYLVRYEGSATVALSAVSFATTPYVSIEVSASVSGSGSPSLISGTYFDPTVPGSGAATWTYPQVVAEADGVRLSEISRQGLSGGVTRITFLCTDSSVSTLKVRWTHMVRTDTISPYPTLTQFVDNVIRSNQAPNASPTGRESLRSVAVRGSARTQASLAIEHATAGLGDVLVYTCPTLGTGYQPDLRRWRTSGGTVTADTATVSGSREVNVSTVIYNVPAAPLPRGSYALVARVRSSSGTISRSLQWSVSTKVGSATVGTQSGTADAATLDATAWSILCLGVMTLPPADVVGSSSATVQVTLPASSTYELDEAWLFYLGDGAALTQVACGTGTPAVGTVHNRLWLDDATLDRLEPSIWTGTIADRSDAFHAGGSASAWGTHAFVPPLMNVFVITTGAANPAVTLRHWPRFHTHATRRVA